MVIRHISSTAILMCFLSQLALADPMSFGLKNEGHVYSTEKASSTMYGDSMGGLMVESSVLRLSAQTDLQKGALDEAIRKARKAVQYDTESTESHLILARALTAKIYDVDFKIAPHIYSECMHEWRLLRWHNPDSSEQSEAGREIVKLQVSKLTAKYRRKKREEEVEAIVLGHHGNTK